MTVKPDSYSKLAIIAFTWGTGFIASESHVPEESVRALMHGKAIPESELKLIAKWIDSSVT